MIFKNSPNRWESRNWTTCGSPISGGERIISVYRFSSLPILYSVVVRFVQNMNTSKKFTSATGPSECCFLLWCLPRNSSFHSASQSLQNIKLLDYIGVKTMQIYLLHVLVVAGTRIILTKAMHLQITRSPAPLYACGSHRRRGMLPFTTWFACGEVMHPKMDIWEVEAAAISLKFFSKEKIKYPLMLGKGSYPAKYRFLDCGWMKEIRCFISSLYLCLSRETPQFIWEMLITNLKTSYSSEHTNMTY